MIAHRACWLALSGALSLVPANAAAQAPGGTEPPTPGGADEPAPQPLAPATPTATPTDAGFEVAERKPPPLVQSDLAASPPGLGREPHHDHRWFWHNLTAVRINPLGLTNRARLGYRRQLSHRPEPIFYDSYLSTQLDTEITPAYGYVGGRVEIQPMVLLNFWGSFGLVGNFGAFSYTRSFASAQAHHDDDFLKDTRDLDYAALGSRGTLSGLFQVGLAGVALRSNTQAHYANMDLRGGDEVFWDATLDVLRPNRGWVITNDADVIFITDFDLKIALRHTVTHALYRQSHLGGGANVNTPHHRIGPALIYTFFEDPAGATWNKPTLVLLSQWWLTHRYRTTQDPALPYLAVAFVQEGDLWLSPKK